jgi:hypothetical protein
MNINLMLREVKMFANAQLVNLQQPKLMSKIAGTKLQRYFPKKLKSLRHIQVNLLNEGIICIQYK